MQELEIPGAESVITSDKNVNHVQLLFDEVPLAFQSLDIDGIIIDVNNKWCDELGYDKEEVIGSWFGNFLIKEERELFSKRFIKFKEVGKTNDVIFNMVKKDGTIIIVSSNGICQYDVQGEFVFTHCVFQNITEKKKAEEKIRKQNIKLKKLDRIKSDFLNITTHELRTPMASIKGYVQMLLKQTLGNITQEPKDALDVILRNTNRLDALIEDILDISRLESGTMKLIPEKTDIKKMIKEVAKTMQSSAYPKNIKINTEIGEEIPELVIDQKRIKQALKNIIDNSIKFSPQDSTINIYIKMKRDNVLFEIQDTGRGISKNKQKKIFERFYQADSGMDRKYGGVGLGLTISKGIIDIHGGRIWVESALDKGSIFTFSLPVKPVQDVNGISMEVDMFSIEE